MRRSTSRHPNASYRGRFNTPRRPGASVRDGDRIYAPPLRPSNVRVYSYSDGDEVNNWSDYLDRRFSDSPSGTDEIDAPGQDSVLWVKNVDFLAEGNSIAHNAADYEITQKGETTYRVRDLVVRRGQPFEIRITFNKPYDKQTDDLRLTFQCSDNPLPSKGTLIELVLSDKDAVDQWGAKILRSEGNVLRVSISTPPYCYVAKWRLTVDVLQSDSGTLKNVFQYQHKKPIYIVFNPWNKNDAVYMEDAGEREEYVMNETGKIYSGSKDFISSKPWNFAQFQGTVLDCAMYVLDTSSMPWTARGDPVKIVRKISAMCNSNDESGIVTGNWTGDYDGGRSPLSWQGSEAILDQYYRTKTSVNFGQCWVFSGVTTTLCRTLGIPARSVTNFESAHDSDGSITIDIYWDELGELLEEKTLDSKWNFHVWNEAWMSRPDLPEGYGGWQAVDATPQEQSDGVMRCGPASVLAIKRGEVHLPYDGPFIFAEVNADMVDFFLNKDGTLSKQFRKKSVGKKISTKCCGDVTSGVNVLRSREDTDRKDVTDLYKFPEDSEDERAAVLRAQACNVNIGTRDIYDTGAQDVLFELIDKEEVYIGQAFNVTLMITNKSAETRTISGRLTSTVIYYTGVPVNVVKRRTFEDVIIKTKEAIQIVMTVTPDEYLSHLVDHENLKISCLARVNETKQVFVNQDDFRLIKPELSIKLPSEAKVGQSFPVAVVFENPLPMPLTSCVLTVEGPGLQKALELRQSDVPARESMTETFTLVPARASRSGHKTQINVSFNSLQLQNIDGCANITVNPK